MITFCFFVFSDFHPEDHGCGCCGWGGVALLCYALPWLSFSRCLGVGVRYLAHFISCSADSWLAVEREGKVKGKTKAEIRRLDIPYRTLRC